MGKQQKNTWMSFDDGIIAEKNDGRDDGFPERSGVKKILRSVSYLTLTANLAL